MGSVRPFGQSASPDDGTFSVSPIQGVAAGLGISVVRLGNTAIIAATDRPNTTPQVNHEWIDSYNALTGVFTQSKPGVQDITAAYGNMYAYNINQTVTIVAPDTFAMVPASLTGGMVNGFTFQNSRELLCGVAGTYLVNWSISCAAANNNQEYEGAVMLNGVGQSFTAAHCEIINSMRPESVSGTGIISLAVNDLLQMCIANHTAANNLILQHLTLSSLRIG